MAPDLQGLGRALLVFGVILAAFGAALVVAPKIPWVGRLPGDILIQRERFTFYFPLASCVLASVVLSVALWLIGRWR